MGVAPTGAQRYLHWEGEVATARGECALCDYYTVFCILMIMIYPCVQKACSKLNSCMVLSAYSSTSMEDVAKACGDGLHWFHLAITMPDELVKDHVARAEKSGYKALVITVDQPNVGVHRHDEHIIHKNYLISFANFNIPSDSTNVNYLHNDCLSCPITWDRIDWVRSLSGLPVVLKGIMTAEDALAAVEHKIDGIIVSNHGGRQLDCVPATV